MKNIKIFRRKAIIVVMIAIVLLFSNTSNIWGITTAQDYQFGTQPSRIDSTQKPNVEVINPYFSIEKTQLSDGTAISKYIIKGASKPPIEYTKERDSSIFPITNAIYLSGFPSYDWVFGCSAVSGAMIAGYYDRNGYENIYTGPTSDGVMPITDTSWSLWYDGNALYPNNPLVASHSDVDGRTSFGSIDDYWVQSESTVADPYITGGWDQHAWGTAIGDFMKTSQSAYGNVDGSTTFYNYTSSSEKLFCSAMEEAGVAEEDGTYGRKLFYEARGYSVTDCYNQKTDNNSGGFTLADFQAEIDAGHPVFLSLAGHSIVGYGYDGSTIYIRDTWDNNPDNTYTMTWGGSYQGLELLSVGIVRIESTTPPEAYPLSVTKAGDGVGNVTSSPTGIDCGSTCTAPFENGIDVTLTALPDAGSSFTGWDGACSGTDNSCVVNMTQSRSVTATFSSTVESNDWVVTGSMNNFRFSHTATLLNNGKVLVAGGCGNTYCSSVNDSAELYDPTTGEWTEISPMNDARVEHIALLLPNGKVLVAGGNNGESINGTAELYDPNTGSWSYTGSLNTARKSFSAILLDNGKVLVAGGMDLTPSFYSTAELYDPETGVWTYTGEMLTNRSSPAAAIKLKNGNVLLAGGWNGASVYSSEIYDPESAVWTETGSMNSKHHYHPAILLPNGQVLVAGGGGTKTVELFNPDSGVWSYTGSLNEFREGCLIVLLESGKVIAAGGKGGGTTSEYYDPETGIWTLTDSMNTVMTEVIPSVLLSDGRVMASSRTNAELYDSRPLVSLEQALGQADPTDIIPINFTVTFSEPIVEASFDETDVTLGGTSGATTVAITEITPFDSTTFNIAVSGMNNGGSVNVDIPAGVVEDSLGNKNLASTSLDNEVTLNGYDINVALSPLESGSVTRDPDLIAYIYGTEVILTPIPAPGFLFSEWTGADVDDIISNENETWSIIMDSSKELIANFVPDTSLYSTYLPLILKKP